VVASKHAAVSEVFPTPLFWEHVNPYGRFELDMATRLPLPWPKWPLAKLFSLLPREEFAAT
jgi:hypothetical protein